jgi:hypothetical protein
MRIVQAEYVEFSDDMLGFCLACEFFTTEGVDVDSDSACICAECGKPEVLAINTAIMLGHVKVNRKAPQIMR